MPRAPAIKSYVRGEAAGPWPLAGQEDPMTTLRHSGNSVNDLHGFSTFCESEALSILIERQSCRSR